MFEVIGMVVVGWIVWSIAKGVISGGLKATLFRAVDFAYTHGVPRHFSIEMIKRPDIIKTARNTLAKRDPNIAALDVYEQYGRALIMMYEGTASEAREEL